MKKLLVLTLLALTGCASISEYQLGCRDGINEVAQSLVEQGAPVRMDENNRDARCKELDEAHKRPVLREKP